MTGPDLTIAEVRDDIHNHDVSPDSVGRATIVPNALVEIVDDHWDIRNPPEGTRVVVLPPPPMHCPSPAPHTPGNLAEMVEIVDDHFDLGNPPDGMTVIACSLSHLMLPHRR